MNHTENYRLPQWEKSDRVLMEDFNQLCRDLDAGFTDAASDNLRLDQKNCEMFRRAAYNHYHLSAAAGSFPRQMGAFHQGMAPLPANARGFLQRDGFAWLAGGPQTSGSTLLNALVQQSPFQVTNGAALSQCKSLVLEFTAPGPMYLDYIQMVAEIRSGSTAVTKFASYTFRDLTAGTTLQEGEIPNSVPAGAVGFSYIKFYAQTYLRLGHRYRLEAKPLAANYTITLDIADGNTTVEAKGFFAQTGTLSYTISDGEESQLGLVLVRFAADEDERALSLRWDGADCPLHKVRSGQWPDGKIYKEAEFLRTGAIPQETQLVLSADCGPGGEFSLYEWGAILI